MKTMLYLKIPVRHIKPKSPHAEAHKRSVLHQLSHSWTLAGFAFSQTDLEKHAVFEEGPYISNETKQLGGQNDENGDEGKG